MLKTYSNVGCTVCVICPRACGQIRERKQELKCGVYLCVCYRHELTTEKRLALCTELHTTVKGKALQVD